jgi:hypothetical protein
VRTFILFCHTGLVSLSALLIRRVALIVLLTFAGARLVDAHLHLCLDGQEAPVTVHTADGSVHNDSHHVEQDHDDRDVDVLDAIFVKKAGSDVEPFVIVIAAVTALEPQRFASITVPPHPPPYRPLLHLRPPLRGPPPL